MHRNSAAHSPSRESSHVAPSSHAAPTSTVARRSRECDSSRQVLRDITSRQHGAVTRAQLADAGTSRARMDNLLRSGRLERIHASVYRDTLTEATEWTRASAAALAATGVHGWRDESGRIVVAVSHRTAAVLRSYLPPPGAGAWRVDVSGQRSAARRACEFTGHLSATETPFC